MGARSRASAPLERFLAGALVEQWLRIKKKRPARPVQNYGVPKLLFKHMAANATVLTYSVKPRCKKRAQAAVFP